MIEKTKKLNVPHQKQTLPIKIAVAGDSQTGKSYMVHRYMFSKTPAQYTPTLGVEYLDRHIEIKDTSIHLNFWDFSGKPEFLDIRNEFYKQANIVLLLVDLSNKKTLDSIDGWVREVKENGGGCSILLVGAKSDVKKVDSDMNKLAKQKGCSGYQEISAKESGESVDRLISEVISSLQ